jgi:Tol biopolymer transport system component
LTQLTEKQGNNFDPAWSPDGTRIAFISDRGQRPPYGTLWLMDADGSNQHPLLDTGDQIELGPTWSPDGTRIAFQSNRGGKDNPDIFILDIASGELKNLTNSPNLDANPAWSPDGKQIAFVSDRSGNPEIWIIDIESMSLLQITARTMLGDWRPSWSPDGQSLIFESFPTVAPRLFYVQGINDEKAQEVNMAFTWNMWPTWITQNQILYAASETYDDDLHEGSPANLYLQNIDTGEMYPLTSGPGEDGHPSWKP